MISYDELLAENARLLQIIRALKEENARLRASSSPQDASASIKPLQAVAEQAKDMYMNTVSTTLGSAIRQARKARNMSQDELASMVGLSKCQIYRVENGLAKSLSTMDAVLKALSLAPVIELKPVKTELTSLAIIRVLKNFKDENADKYGIQKIGLFGSYAREEQTIDSDVDVCVLLEAPRYMMIAAIKDELETLFDREVDVVSLSAKMAPAFKESIENEAIYV